MVLWCFADKYLQTVSCWHSYGRDSERIWTIFLFLIFLLNAKSLPYATCSETEELEHLARLLFMWSNERHEAPSAVMDKTRISSSLVFCYLIVLEGRKITSDKRKKRAVTLTLSYPWSNIVFLLYFPFIIFLRHETQSCFFVSLFILHHNLPFAPSCITFGCVRPIFFLPSFSFSCTSPSVHPSFISLVYVPQH